LNKPYKCDAAGDDTKYAVGATDKNMLILLEKNLPDALFSKAL